MENDIIEIKYDVYKSGPSVGDWKVYCTKGPSILIGYNNTKEYNILAGTQGNIFLAINDIIYRFWFSSYHEYARKRVNLTYVRVNLTIDIFPFSYHEIEAETISRIIIPSWEKVVPPDIGNLIHKGHSDEFNNLHSRTY